MSFIGEEPPCPLRVMITRKDGSTCGFEGVRPDTAQHIRGEMKCGYQEGTVVARGEVLDWKRTDLSPLGRPEGWCPECRGTGKLSFHSLQRGFQKINCPSCKGKGVQT